jgi:hypothetical protein
MAEITLLNRNTKSGVQPHKKVDIRADKFKTNDPSTPAFGRTRVALNAPVDTTGDSLMEFGGDLANLSDDVERREAARAANQLEVNNMMEDRSNNKIDLQLRREFQLETGNIVGAFSTQDMSKPKVQKDYNEKISTALESYQDKYTLEGGTDRGLDAFRADLFSQANGLQDQGIIRQRDDMLSGIKGFRADAFNNLNDPAKVDKAFGGNPTALIPSLLAETEVLSGKFNKGLPPEEQSITNRLALSTVQNIAFDFYLRRGDMDAIEGLFVNKAFDAINGFEGELALITRWNSAKNSKYVTVYNTQKGITESVLESEQKPWQVDPSSVTTNSKMSQLQENIRRNSKLPEGDPSKLSFDVILSAADIKLDSGTLTALEKELKDNKTRAGKLSKGDPKLEAEILDDMNQTSVERSVPVSKEDKAIQEGVDETNKDLGKATQVVKIQKDKNIPDDVKRQLNPEERLPVNLYAESRKTLTNMLGGSTDINGKATFNDSVQQGIYSGTLPIASRLTRDPAYANLGPPEIAQMALKEYAEANNIEGNPVLANSYSRAAARVRSRRKAKEYDYPIAGETSGSEARAALLQEATDLNQRQGQIDPAKAVGFGSAYLQFLSNLPGQFFEGLVDDETVNARLALLRVSREVMTLVMKNDRYAIAEQNVIVKLLEGPNALTSGRVIKAQLRRFLVEVERGIIDAELAITEGIKRDENLEKVVDFTRIASMLDQFDLAAPLVGTSPEDILKMNDLKAFSKLEHSMKDGDLDKMTPAQIDALRVVQNRFENGGDGAAGDIPSGAGGMDTTLDAMPAEILQGYADTVSAEVSEYDTQLSGTISDDERKQITAAQDKSKKLLNSINRSITGRNP